MKIKGIIFEDFVNYKEPCMTIEFPYCNWKCDRECGRTVCQNSELAKAPDYEITPELIVDMFIRNDISDAICFQGLEPFDSLDWLELVTAFRQRVSNTIVIYTGYTEKELQIELKVLSEYENIIVKFGRFIPDQPSHYDELLGVELASLNQYAKKIGHPA